jgi:hypothetical protein
VSSRAAVATHARTQDRGNESLKLGTPFHLRQAAMCYSQALAQGDPDPKANSVYLANRAQAHLQLRNWGHALRDGRAAVQLHPGNVKAAFRAAKAAAQLGKHVDVLEMCTLGLSSAFALPRFAAQCQRCTSPPLTIISCPSPLPTQAMQPTRSCCACEMPPSQPQRLHA